jgi:N utilization substance protein B
MTRSNARELAVHLVYELEFSNGTADELMEEAMTRQTFARIGQEEPLYTQFPNAQQREYIATLVQGVYEHTLELDNYISKYAIGWNISRIPRVVVAILRVCMYEILYMQDIPNAAAINEAVELTKRYEEQELASFVNGILGSFVRSEPLHEPVATVEEGVFDAPAPEAAPEEAPDAAPETTEGGE